MDELVAMGAGGGLICLVFMTSVMSGMVHFALCRYWLICFLTGMSLLLLTFTAWLFLDVLDPDAGDRMYYSMPLLPWSFVLAFIGSAIAGLPAVVIRAASVSRNTETHSDDGK